MSGAMFIFGELEDAVALNKPGKAKFLRKELLKAGWDVKWVGVKNGGDSARKKRSKPAFLPAYTSKKKSG